MRAETRHWFEHVAEIGRIRANPAIDECPNCTLMKPRAKPVCECCQAEARGEHLSDHQESAYAA